jgi:hypothetical protein
MFEQFVRVALITTLLGLPWTENNWRKHEPRVQIPIEQIKSTVQSALPSDWKVIGERADQPLWPGVDTLRDRYKGYAIDLAGPSVTKVTGVKGSSKAQTVTFNKAAVLYFIPVWSGITRTQLITDRNEAARTLDARSVPQAQGPPRSQQVEGIVYGWNSQYLLVCKKDCEVVERVARKFKIPKK